MLTKLTALIAVLIGLTVADGADRSATNRLTAKEVEAQLHVFSDHYSAARCRDEGREEFFCLATYRDAWVDPVRVQLHVGGIGEDRFAIGRCEMVNPGHGSRYACQHLMFSLNHMMGTAAGM